ncbi:hypothetical protein [Macrococcus brunensis]|uniref:hypothetical protein n=1 Tax=Macrococcus brunensis TaxID=198483 RepID=UPI001EF0FE19|nr:hypothetical protein [Macrococcus brunensis]ULG72066.1 hypothetical protein MGG12_00645 [Macrococcus brunensis]ULG74319.1 hypothetical protein MGG13_00670 [Macrococcus brunensis]
MNIYYLLHTIQLHHHEPFSYQQLKNLTVHPLTELSENEFEEAYMQLREEKLIEEGDNLTLSFFGETILKKHQKKQQFNHVD